MVGRDAYTHTLTHTPSHHKHALVVRPHEAGPPPPEEPTHLLGQVLVQLVVTLVNVSGYGGQR